MASSNLYYFKVLGIQPDFTTDDIIAYFQTARCGSGIVQEVIYLDARNSAVLIGIEGLTERAIDKLFKGVHKIKGKSVSVRHAKPPTDKQTARAAAVLTAGGHTVHPTLPIPQDVPHTKVPAQQEPLQQCTQLVLSTSSHSSMTIGSEQLASQGGYSGTAIIPSQSGLQQDPTQAAPPLISPQVDSTPDRTQASFPPVDLGGIDPSLFANMNVFEAAKLLPPQCPVTLPEIEQVQSSAALRGPSLLEVSTADASKMPLQNDAVQAAIAFPSPPPLVDHSQIGNEESRKTRIAATQQSVTQLPSGQWPASHDEDRSSQAGYMLQHFQGSTAQQQGAQAKPRAQHGTPTGIQQGGLQHGDFAGTQPSTHAAPWQLGNTGLQHGVHASLRHGSHTGWQHDASVEPQYDPCAGPQEHTHSGSEPGGYSGLQYGAHVRLQHDNQAAAGPQYSTNTRPELGIHVGPQHGGNIGPQHGGNIGPQHGGNIGPQHGGNIGPQHGGNIGPQHGGNIGPQHGGNIGPQHGGNIGPQLGNIPTLQHGTNTGPEQGIHFGTQHGGNIGPQHGGNIRPQLGNTPTLQYGTNTGPEQGIHSGSQHGGNIGPQHGGHIRPQHGGHIGPQHGGNIGPQHSGNIAPQHGGNIGPQLGMNTPHQSVQIGQQHVGIWRSNGQGAIGTASVAAMGYVPDSIGNGAQSTLPTKEGFQTNVPQEWPTSSTDLEEPVPPVTQSHVWQHLPPSVEGGVVVQVDGGAGLKREYFELAFDDEDKGGGEIDEISLQGDIALISFKDVKVAAQVASKGIWPIMGRTVQVSLYQPKLKPDPLHHILAEYTRENTLVLRDLPALVADNYLTLYIEMETKMNDASYKLDRREDTALLKLTGNTAQNVLPMLSSSIRPLDKETKAMLKVEFLAPVKTVLIEGIKDDYCSEDLLQMYFRNKKKSGVGVNVTVEVTGRGQAAVTFEDLSVISSVLSHDHSKVLGPKVSVKLYHPILSHWFKVDGTSDSRPQRAVSMQHKRFTVGVSATIQHHINRTDLINPLNEKLNETCANATLGAWGILVEPTTGSEWDRQWAARCKEIIDSYIANITVLPLDVPPGVMANVYPVIMAQVHNPNVTISTSGSGDQVVMIGSTSDVEELKEKVSKIIYENLDTTKEEALPVPVLVLIDQCVGQRLKGEHKNVLFETDLRSKVLQVNGKDSSCDMFLENVRMLLPEVIDVRLGEEAVGLVASATGKSLLLSKIGEQAVGYYFTNAEGEVPFSDVAVVSRLHLVSENRKVALKVAQSLQKTIVTFSVDVPEELKHTVHSDVWCATRRRIESAFIALLLLQPEKRKIIGVCDSKHAEQIKVDLKQFVQGECYMANTIEMERLQWEYMETHSKDWKELLEQIKGSGLKYSVPGASGSAVIKMEGEVTPVRRFTCRIHEIRDGIKVGKKEVSKPGVVKHFESTVGRNFLKGIAAGQKAVVKVYRTEDEADNVRRATGSLHRKIGQCTTDDGRVVNIVQGDLTEFSADVIVNAANEQLNHTGGIAGIIARKGGTIVQEESTKHVERDGQLQVGDAVLLKAVGNLPCKALVHTVGPRWNGGQAHEEAYLAKAVRNSLVEASKNNYTSIAFPAISSGIFGVPIPVCAKAMMQGIKEFSLMGHPPQLHSITIMLFQDEHVSIFTQAASGALKSFSQQIGGHVGSLPYSSALKKPSSMGPRRPSGVPVMQGLELKKGSLTAFQADVYVNTAHNQLDLKHGAVAHSLLKAGGSALQDECDQVVAGGGTIPYWDIATTSGGNLQCRHIIHTVGAKYKGTGCEKNLESMITKVMQESTRLNATSVAFPAIGTGNLGFPEDVVAKVMVRSISDYLRQNLSTTVKKVLLVIFMDSTHNAFQQVMPRFPSVPSASLLAETDSEVIVENWGASGAPRPSEAFPAVSYELLRSFTCNRVNVDIVNGDISTDDSEGIVNTASDNLKLHNFGVMGALLRKGGQELQDDCNAAVTRHGKLDPSKVILTGPGKPGGLKCKKVIHVLAPGSPGGLVKTVKACLHRADKEGLKSVALPAIGTGQHGFTPAEAAAAIAEGIVQFSTSSHDHVSHIKVVLFQRELFESFSAGFAEAGNAKGFVRKALDMVGGAWSSVKAMFESSPKQPPLPVQHSGSTPFVEGRVLCIKVYADSQTAIDTIFWEVDKAIDETIQEECIKDVKVDKLAPEAVASLEGLAVAHHVKISVDRSPLNQVCLKGDKADVARMTNEVWKQLNVIERQQNRRKEADLLTSKFQWQWKDDKGEFQNYEAMMNLEIEEALGNHAPSVMIRTEVGPRIIDFSNLLESEGHPPFNSTSVRRRDYEQERKEGEHPSFWDHMPRDPSGTGREVECHVVKLSPHSQEYKDVAAKFNSTMGGGAQPIQAPLTLGLTGTLAGVRGAQQGRIQKIERIQNPKLYAQYIARKKVMDRANPGQGRQNERQLFHGCRLDVVDAINHGGFNRSYSGQQAAHYGRGSYFARNANYSANARYSAPDLNGHQHMYLARVLTGEYTTGNASHLVPPPKDPNNPAVLYDSVVDNDQNPSIFVIFYDPQAYPEYHIAFC